MRSNRTISEQIGRLRDPLSSVIDVVDHLHTTACLAVDLGDARVCARQVERQADLLRQYVAELQARINLLGTTAELAALERAA